MNREKISDIKIIFTDLDKTLLNDNKEISIYTKNIFSELRQRGIRVVISTARIWQTAYKYYKELGCSGIIYCNGAVVKYKNNLIRKYKISIPTVCSVISNVMENVPEIHFSIMTTNRMYTNYYDKNTIYIKDYKKLELYDCIRIMFYDSDAKTVERLLKNWCKEINIVYLEEKNVLVCSSKATKLNGINAILNYLGLSKNEAVVFGDDWNDLLCIENVRYGVTVANADERIKLRARYLCESNNEDGVAKWIEKYLI